MVESNFECLHGLDLGSRFPEGTWLLLCLLVVFVAGTVVKRKRGGKFLADLVNPGDELVVARGGRGGVRTLQGGVRRTLRGGVKTLQALL